MKSRNLFYLMIAVIIMHLLSFSVNAQLPGYQMKLTNAEQVSCNVYEFDIIINSTQPTNLLKIANFQVGILVNPGIVPAGATMQIAPVPGSCELTNPQQHPGPEKFLYNPTTNCIQVAPVVPVGSANASTIPLAGNRLFRLRVTSSMPFVSGTAPDHSWNFTLSIAYPTKVFGYIGIINNDVTNQASHLLVFPDNPVMTGGFADPLPQEVTTNMIEFCNVPGQGATISLTSTQPGYSYYLYSDGVMVPGPQGVLFGTGSAGSFNYLATGNVMSVKSVGCLGDVNMLNTVSLAPIPPVTVSVDIDAVPGITTLPGTPVTFTATTTNAGLTPYIYWFVNGITDYINTPIFTYTPMDGDQVYCALYPSTEVCTENIEVFSDVLNMTVTEFFNVSGGGTICEGTDAIITLSGSQVGILYTLYKDGIQYLPPVAGTGLPLEWMVSEAGMYTVITDLAPMLGNAEVLVDPLPVLTGPIVGQAFVMESTFNVPYSVSPIDYADTYFWEYSGTGVTINGTGTSVTLDFAVGATSGQIKVKGTNNCGFVESFFDVFVEIEPVCDPPTLLGANNTTDSSADLFWTGGNLWDVEVGLPGFTPGTGTAVTGATSTSENPWTAEGLNPGTSYEFYVRNDCGFIDPKVDNFWMAMSLPGVLEPTLSGGTYNEPGEDGTWYLYNLAPSQPWWNIWFYNDPPDTSRIKKIRMGFWVQPYQPGPATLSYVFNWSTPDWDPLIPSFPTPADEIYIDRSPVNGPMPIVAPQWVELYYTIEDYNPEWISIDIWGENIQILDISIPPPADSPILQYWIPGMIGGTVVHECLPKTSSSGWTGPESFETCQDYTIITDAEICDNEVYLWDNNSYNTSGQWIVTYPTTNPPGCDSTLILNLTVHPTYSSSINAAICDGDVYSWEGSDYDQPGTYTVTYQSIHGCDSILVLNLTVYPTYEFVTNAEICDGDVYNWRGSAYTQTGTYTDAFLTQDGCDSVYVLNLIVHPTYLSSTTVDICDNNLPYIWEGNSYNSGGSYSVTYQTIFGCDSILILNLNVHPTESYVTNAEICEGETFSWMNNDYTLAGTYYEYGTTAFGCLITYELNLTVHPSYYFIDYVNIYDYEVPYFWQGNNYTASGTYYANYQSVNGCDSIYELNLVIKPYIPLYVTKNIGSAVQANWEPIPDANLYQLRYRELPSGGWLYVTQSTQLFRKIASLTPGTQYELQLRHKVGMVWQLWNSAYAPITFTTNVIDFVSTYDIGTKFRVDWTPIDDISSYILQYRVAGSTTWLTKGYYQTNTAVMNPVVEGGTYEFRVCPRYNEVSFEWSQTGSITSTNIVINVNYSVTEAMFSWQAVTNPDASDYILQIREQGTTSITSYFVQNPSVLAYNLLAGTQYEYRLVVRYAGVAWGATSWRPLVAGSKEETAAIQSMNELNVYPNPVSEMLTVELMTTADATHVWKLYDVTGKLVLSGTNTITSGLNYMQIETGQLPTGMYMLQSNFNGMVRTSRVIKQ